MAEAYGNILDPPGFKTVAEVKPGDILASYSPPPLVKGGTLSSGQGLVAAGTVMALNTSTKKYVPYVAAGPNGTGNPTGVLYEPVDTALGDKLGNIIMGGQLKRDKLIGLDAGAITALNGRVIDRSTEASNVGDIFAF
jgi:hypothetical protein